MKTVLAYSLIGLLGIVGCSTPNESSKLTEDKQETQLVNVMKYPKDVEKIFNAHGGMKLWQSMRTLSYDMVKPDYVEHQTIDLHSRKVKIEQDKFTIGFDGKEVWVSQKDTNTFNGDARFYHNLYFYFFAMPFVLGDDGITYEQVEALKIDGGLFPGIKISYNDGVGDSSKDNYFLYYNPDTYKVEWLGYTVTYFDDKPSQEIHYLNFENWKLTSDILLPETLTWYNLDLSSGDKTKRGSMTFENVTVSKDALPNDYFQNIKK